jgi:UDP-2-acetamido-2,6-beta-L-arabino-hexul-4-ose reductase
VNVVITGGFGFLGWHVACRLRAKHGIDARRIGRSEFTALVEGGLAEVDVVLHLAGVNRAPSDDEVRSGNVDLAARLAQAVARAGQPLRMVYANSTQSALDNAYGRSKGEAALVLSQAVESAGGSFVDVILPNLFGEHGLPYYNSFVATFVDQVVQGKTPTVEQDRSVHLLHVQEAAAALISAAFGTGPGRVEPQGQERSVGQVLQDLQGFHRLYSTGDVPDLSSSFSRDLFNTYRARVFPSAFPMYPELHSDPRGTLFESSRSHGGQGQTFVSTTAPGRTRGEHYHLNKVERFVVVRGEAEIAMRRLLTDEVVRYRITGERPGFVDMPTLWVHNLRNTGSDELVTMFWSNQLLEADNVDQYPEMVEAVPA